MVDKIQSPLIDMSLAPVKGAISNSDYVFVRGADESIEKVLVSDLLAGTAGAIRIRGEADMDNASTTSTSVVIIGDPNNATMEQGVAPVDTSPNGVAYVVKTAQSGIQTQISGTVQTVFDGDQIIWSGSKWSILALGNAVTSVDNQTGAVNLEDKYYWTGNKPSIGDIPNLQGTLDSKYSPANKPTPAEIGAKANSYIPDWEEITNKPGTSTRWPSFAEVTNKPSSATRWPTFSEVTSKPATATRWPAFSEVTGKPTYYPTQWEQVSGKPTTFPTSWGAVTGKPETFPTMWDSVADKPATATRWSTWSEVTGKPSTFTPSAHTHTAAQVSGLGTAATKNVGTIAGTVAEGNDSRIVNAVPNSRTITAGTGLTGGGNLTANRTVAISSGTVPSTAKQLSSENLDTVQAPGYYYQPANANATTGRNYPVGSAGTLVVTTAAGVIQEYTSYGPTNRKFTRGYYNRWSAWKEVGGTVSWSQITGQPATATRWPTKAEVGLSNVPNYTISNATNDPSTNKFASTAAVYSVSQRVATLEGAGGSGGTALMIGSMMDFPPLPVGKVPHAGYIPMDGSLISRTDYQDLWLWANDMGIVVSEADWQSIKASSHGGAVSVYSVGTGGDTFRVPDVGTFGMVQRPMGSTRPSETDRVRGFADQLKSHSHTVTVDAGGSHRHSLYLIYRNSGVSRQTQAFFDTAKISSSSDTFCPQGTGTVFHAKQAVDTVGNHTHTASANPTGGSETTMKYMWCTKWIYSGKK